MAPQRRCLAAESLLRVPRRLAGTPAYREESGWIGCRKPGWSDTANHCWSPESCCPWRGASCQFPTPLAAVGDTRRGAWPARSQATNVLARVKQGRGLPAIGGHFSTMASEVGRKQQCLSRPLPQAMPAVLEGGRLWTSRPPGRAIALIRLEKMTTSQQEGEQTHENLSHRNQCFPHLCHRRATMILRSMVQALLLLKSKGSSLQKRKRQNQQERVFGHGVHGCPPCL